MRVGKGFNLFISNEDMNDILKIIKLLKDLGVLIDVVTETIPASIVQPLISSVFKIISGRGVRRVRRKYIDKNF